MAPKSHNASSGDDQPNPASSSAKDSPDAGSPPHSKSDSLPASPSATQPMALDAPEIAGESELATKTTTTDSDPSAKDAISGPSPYGTRSRNRGQPRPNYAEDKDVDTDMFDAYPDKKEAELKKTSRQAANGTTDAPRAASINVRKPADESKTATPQTTTKDQTAGATTASSTVATPATSTSSKKRKATAQPATNGAQAQTTVAVAQSSTTTRRSTTTVTNTPTANSPGGGYKETNMLSFDRYGAKPKDGKLTADDGSVIQKNGRSHGNRTNVYFGELRVGFSVLQAPVLTLVF